MAPSGKKGKGKTGTKQKNKKGKNQEESQGQTPQLEIPPEQQEQPQQELSQLEADAEAQPQQAEVTPNLDSVPEPIPELEVLPEKEAELEQHPTVEEVSTPAAEHPPQSPPPAEGHPTQQTEPELASHQHQDVEDAWAESGPTLESHVEDINLSERPLETTEIISEDKGTSEVPSGTAEPSEPTPVTAPQTPLLSTGPASIPLPSPSPTETQFIATSPRAHAEDLESDPPFTTPTNRFFDSTAHSSITEDFLAGSKPASPAPQAASTPVPASPGFKASSPVPYSSHSPRAASPFSKPASPVPRTHSPLARAISPMEQPASPKEEAALPMDKAASPQQVATPVSRAASPMQQPPSPAPQAASPVPKPASPVQKLVSPVPKSASPVPKISSPLARSAYMSPVMSPHASPPPPAPTVPGMSPSVAPSYATAYHSPVMTASPYMPQYAYYHHPPPNMPTPRGSIDPPSATSFQALRDLAYANGHGINRKGTMSPPEHEEPIELLQRIQDAIPDINRLLDSYKNTKGKLNAREAEFKHLTNQHEQDLMHKDFYIEALQNQMRKTAAESAEESRKLKNTINELRMELGNLEEKRKDFEEKFEDAEKSNEELSARKTELEGEITTLNNNLREAQEAHERELEKQKAEKEEALASQKQELTELFEEIRAEDEKTAAENLEAREKELLGQQEAMKADYEKEKQQMQESHDALQAEYDSKVSELESTKTALDDKQKELDDTREQHAKEIESMKNSHEATVAEMNQRWTEEKNDLEKRLTDKIDECAGVERENKKLEEDNLVKEQQLQHAVDGMRTTIDNLDKDCDRLRKTLHSLGEATDLKSTKGDSFFLDCFGQLSHLIVSLSQEHFTYLAIDPPKDILSKLPPELPSFLDNTPASRELRAAYVQHVISKTLTYRIFHPFLFTLGRRYDKADTFFQMLSMDIRRKSVRREAFWRQQTLKAAYTTSDAKQSINVVAAVIVDEIVDHLKHFADPRRLDSLVVGVRKIVKLAAETWRHARVERELILASLPAPEAEVSSNDDWEECGTPKEGTVGSRDDPSRHVILRTFPRIMREAAHEDFAEDPEKAAPCIYARGGVLYSDSPVVIARLQELAKKSTDALACGEEVAAEGVKA
ncbi:conserved hypothetical protein [Aspergillus terreus NIH2624]|uniref:RNA polymerase Rpb1 C-terminal repeat domain-containing protein n=1 Tax=Aspergillus terreus (strain NIH 2624 / FGSC A1156) TaxID=341663 RepID=Q0D1Z1_ASPTN|nr:uncharacterized protein ATEG_00043 [Aspergillus terreus NIH2624]EAU38689.1 conserved hypothetical protein [Aspergillus terreus NIH2624]